MTKLSTALPAELAAAVAELMENQPRNALRERARNLSAGYRARLTTRDTIRNEADALAYALTRLPATYAAAASVLGRLRGELDGFAPRRALDLGCGLGAASFAAREAWPGIESVTLLDRSREFLSLARRLEESGSLRSATHVEFAEADLTRLPPFSGEPHDLVLINYALTELSDSDLVPMLDAAWARTGGLLVLIEPGTPRDHTRLMTARARLIALGANILAPCPHARPCPLMPPDWCHFSARLPRLRDHRLLKNADAPFEDEKFSYLAAARPGLAAPAGMARIIAPPRALKHGVTLALCHNGGISETMIAKRDKPRFEIYRKSAWGGRVPAPAKEAL